ncbi:MAG: molybdenum cofactor guanylyltransferase [Pseudomonadota bacterium]|nr:molybdenum cofactor guanylyltransferase [Burkholderiaceae bacterium]MDQ3445479.1 molybdenum cofactor guanylyltransferase [Pseudomonadota bacterium]
MKNVTGLVLAGGRGRRVGGADKGWLIYEGRPLIVSVVERFAPQVGPLLISANRNLERYAAFGEVVGDDVADVSGERFAGPLIGALSGLRRARTDWVAIVPCDAPHLPTDLVPRLLRAALSNDVMAACASVHGHLQPVFALVKTSCADGLARSIANGERAMHRWLKALEAAAVDFDDPQAFTNINKPIGNGNRETHAADGP